MADNKLTTLTFSCACKQVSGSVKVPSANLPLPLSFCHCNTCRHQSGLLAASFVSLPKNHEEFTIKGSTETYKASEQLVRHFCGTCGSNVYVDDRKFDEFSLSSGSLQDSEDVVQLKHQIFVADAKDGGMSTWLPNVPGWEGFAQDSKPVDCSRQTSTPPTSGSTSSELHGYCSCRSIQFKITRPNEKSKDLHGPFADLLAPYVSRSPENKDDAKWWLRRKDTKYLAGTCACNSCRTNSGFDIQTWTFIPKVNLFDIHGAPLDVESTADLTEYGSSEGVHRYFCRTCGATVFWRCDPRPDLIDVSVGMLDAEEGARAESWLEWWTDRVSFDEEASNKALVTSLKDGLRRWGDAREGTRTVK